MRLAAALCLAEVPSAVALWSVFHWDALGAEGGVLWCWTFLTGIVAILVLAAHAEAKASR